MNLDPQRMAILGELLRHVDPHALLDIDQNLLIAGLIPHQQQPQPILRHHLQRGIGHIGLGIAGPRHPQLAQLLGNRLGPRQVIGEGVIVEKQLLHLREGLEDVFHLLNHMPHRAGAIAMPAHRLRPETKRAAALAAAPGIEADIRMLQIADKILLPVQITLIHLRDEGQLVHILQHRAVLIMHDHAGIIPPAQPLDGREVHPRRHILDGEIKLIARHPIHHRRITQGFLRLHRHLGADQPHLQRGIHRLERLSHLDVRGEAGGGGVQHQLVKIPRHWRHIGQGLVVRRRVNQLRALDQRRRLGQPGGEPIAADFPLRLIARARTAIETIEGGSLKEEGAHHRDSDLCEICVGVR